VHESGVGAFGDMPTDCENVCSSGQSGSERRTVKTALMTHLGLSRLSNNLHEAGSDHGGIGSSVSFSLELRATQNPPPLAFQNSEHLFYLSTRLRRPDCREKTLDL
jgi:hypothetical protein